MGAFSNDRRKNNGYRLADNRFMLDLPADWADRSVYRFEGPLEDGIQHHIAVTIAHDLDTTELEAYAGMQIKALEKELQGYHELKRGPLALGNGLAAFELVYQWCCDFRTTTTDPPRYFWVVEYGRKRFGQNQESGLLRAKPPA